MTEKESGKSTSPAIDVAREMDAESDGIVVINGIRVRLNALPAAIIDEVTGRIPKPDMPTYHNEEYNRDEPNPDDPAYKKALEDAEQQQTEALIDACAMFGIELVDGLPEDEEWLRKLKFMEKRGRMDLSNYDLKDEYELAFVYKRYMIATIGLVLQIQEMSAVTPAEVAKQRASFPGN